MSLSIRILILKNCWNNFLNMITVITRTQFPPSMIEKMEDLTDRSMMVFSRQKGFISMDVKRDLNKGGTLSIFRWRELEDHHNSMSSPDWGSLTKEWEDFIAEDEVEFYFIFIGGDWKSAN